MERVRVYVATEKAPRGAKGRDETGREKPIRTNRHNLFNYIEFALRSACLEFSR